MSEEGPFVLVVEDDGVIREALAFNLSKAGYRPVAAADGETGWGLLEAEPEKFATVLLDRTLPGMDGMEVLARIKAHAYLRRVPVILETARAGKRDILEGLEAGAFYYLTKPFDKKTLLAIVRTAVGDGVNYQQLCQRTRQTIGSFSLMLRGSYAFRTVEEAKLLAALVAHCCSDPERAVVGLSELLINAVEHGNLGITYEEKSRLVEDGAWEDEVARRLELPANRDKRVIVEIERRPDVVAYRVKDEGRGFDWEKYLDLTPERAFDSHGRGIALSRKLSFDEVTFVGNGSEVIAVVRQPPAA